MNVLEKIYIDHLRNQVVERIYADINYKNLKNIKEELSSYVSDRTVSRFQEFYFLILENESEFLNKPNFFRQFKRHYALQGIDSKTLDAFEASKREILVKIKQGNLISLYFEHFHKVKMKHGENIREKNLGSFFSKFVHTFLPHEYCALDNPIRRYLGLGNESFIISFFVISSAYVKWTKENSLILVELRNELQKVNRNYERATDLKILDIVYWYMISRNSTDNRGVNSQ